MSEIPNHSNSEAAPVPAPDDVGFHPIPRDSTYSSILQLTVNTTEERKGQWARALRQMGVAAAKRTDRMAALATIQTKADSMGNNTADIAARNVLLWVKDVLAAYAEPASLKSAVARGGREMIQADIQVGRQRAIESLSDIAHQGAYAAIDLALSYYMQEHDGQYYQGQQKH